MTDPDTLHVWYGEKLVGLLRRNATNQVGFQYCDGWLAGPSGFAISISLPLSPDPYQPEDALAHRFFANLLPEGRVRENIVRDLKIPDSDFDLLRAIGGECAGALSILPDDREPAIDTTYRELTAEAFRDLILRKGQIYTGPHAGTTAHEFPRLSLAGAQEKCPVLLRDSQFFLPQGEAPSSHILKFAITDYRHVPAYETVLTDLARRIELHTAVVEFHYLYVNEQAHDYLVIERYDREPAADGEIRRLHQEDFCQALGVGRERKYETSGGVDFTECFRLLREVSSEPALDAEQYLTILPATPTVMPRICRYSTIKTVRFDWPLSTTWSVRELLRELTRNSPWPSAENKCRETSIRFIGKSRLPRSTSGPDTCKRWLLKQRNRYAKRLNPRLRRSRKNTATIPLFSVCCRWLSGKAAI